MSFFPHLSEDIEKTVYLLNRKDCRRLIEDDYFRAIAEDFKDLQCLLFRDSHIGDNLVQIYFKAELCGCIFYLFTDVCAVHEPSRIPHSDTDIFERRKTLDQLKVLVYHSYSQFAGIFR